MMRSSLLFFFYAVVLSLLPAAVYAQTGKIAGTVVDASTGEPLPGVNVVIEGENIGAVTDVDGFYNIIGVRPGTYDLRASFIGFTPAIREAVEVNIDLTTEVDFSLQEQAIGMDEIVVAAERPVVKRDLSASRVDISAEEIENLPVSDLESVVGLQAGVQGMSIRGGEAQEVLVMVDGLSLNSKRDNAPYTNFSYAGIEEIQVQSGGFNAEYGDMRSGVVNVVTKEGPRDRYTADIILRYSNPSSKHFGIAPNDPDAYWIRPYLDPNVAFTGTDNPVDPEAWSEFVDLQFPDFVGYNTIARQSLQDDDPNNDLTPEAARQLFLWRHRKVVEPTEPDYVIDGGIGGPVPFIGRYLGNLRFYATYRTEEEQYIVPLSRPGYDAYNARVKLTSDVGPGMKLMLQYMKGRELGTTATRSGATELLRHGSRMYYTDVYNRNFGIGDAAIFAAAWWSQGDLNRELFGGKFTHTLSPSTFYEVTLQRYTTTFDAYPFREVDTTPVIEFAGFQADEMPLAYTFLPRRGEITGFWMGTHTSEFRDTSQVAQWEGSFTLTSQINRYNQIKGGVEVNVANNDINYGHIDFLVNPNDIRANYNKTPFYAAVFLQDKLEFRGMIANLGLRLDYFNPNTQWWSYEDPFIEAFMGKNEDLFPELVEEEAVPAKVALSPRLGVSFPVTDVSKLYFNYGHFYQTPNPDNLYTLERMQSTDAVWFIANPFAPMPRTIAYELGYEQGLFDQYLIRLAGYYRDVTNQPRTTQFTDLSGLVDYRVPLANNYEDIRGFEISLFKNRGKFFRGFVNYTYMVKSEGEFGLGRFFENRVEQRELERQTWRNYQYRPLPQPYARISLDFLTPPDFGPEAGGFNLLGDWRFNLTGYWEAGSYFTYTGDTPMPGVENNMQWEDYKMVDLRVSKNFNLAGVEALLYADIYNVLNIENFNPAAFAGSRDFQNYLNSLHLPEEMVEGWKDQYVPRDPETNEPIYGDDVPGTLGKEYIDPPNASSFRALFPRDVFFGMRFSF